VRLATLRDGTRDGALIVVSRSAERYALATSICATLQAALDDWDVHEPRLRELAAQLESRLSEVHNAVQGEALDTARLLAPLPRAYEWLDGSAFLNHVELVRRARGAELPASLRTDPLIYQGGSGVLLGAREPLVLPDPSWGLDYEAEVCVVVRDVARGSSAELATGAITLLMLANDVSYRNLIPEELSKGFGFVISKPATVFSPFAITPDELGPAYSGGRVHLALSSFVNGQRMGEPEAGEEMHFSFADLIAHVCRTRALVAGTIVGSGTVSNRDRSRGVSCLAELRMHELLERGRAETPFLDYGDRVRIEMLDREGRNLFGSIEQEVVRA
jgi:fumarylacetoacetate (FAA) hydrolase